MSELCHTHPQVVTEAWLLPTSVYRPQGRYRDVANCCNRVLATNPVHPAAHSLLGSAMACLGVQDESVHHLTKVRSLAPNNLDILMNLRSALHAIGRLEEAIGNF